MAQQNNRRGAGWVLLGLVAVGLVLTIGAVAAVYFLNAEPSLEEGTVLEITLDGEYRDGPAPDPFAELGFGPTTTSLWDVRQALRKAADDDNIVGVLVTIRSPSIGMGQRQELVEEFVRYREESGKPVHALIQTDLITDGNYYLATGASKIWVTPEAWWVVNGFQADVSFWRGTLDKLKVQPDVIMFKEYKSAGESFGNYEMSEAMRESLTDVLGDIYGAWLDDVASRRTLERDQLESYVNEGTLTGARAREVGLADELGYRDQVQEALKLEAGTEEYEKIGLRKYLERGDRSPAKGERIALVFAEGPIVSAPGGGSPFGMSSATIYGPAIAKEIRKAAEDDDVKAVVFRVNSPGGSAVGSDLIWREIERAQEKGKPVVVSMASVAGSGGYWVAMGADAIVAQPMTITGSIGVVFTKLNIKGFYEWIGAHVDTVTFSENAGLFSEFESFTEEQRAKVVESIGATYENFVRKVAEGRGKSFDETEPLAHGRIWSGKDALGHGLVDELGGLDVAIRLAAEEAGLDSEVPTIEVFPKQKDFFEQLLEGEFNVVAAPPSVDVEAWLREVSAPKVQALAPTIRVY